MPLVGGLLDRYGPRLLRRSIGGLIVGEGGYSGALHLDDDAGPHYGVVGGVGVGIVYNCTDRGRGRWFPDRRGLAVGATVLGFGLSPLITAPARERLIASAMARFPPWRTSGLPRSS